MMADEQEQKSQDQAQQKVNVPGDVTTNNGEDTAAILAKHNELNDKGAKLFKEYGVANAAQFIDMVASNPIIARKVATKFLHDNAGVDFDDHFGAAGLILDQQAPQENNITGTLDHTGDVATKLHIDGESEAPPVVDDTDGVKQGTVDE